MSPIPNLWHEVRGLVPQHSLTFIEAHEVAERQAARLRHCLQIADDELPTESLRRLPRTQVIKRANLPVSALTHWKDGRWLIVLNAEEPSVRQRFSLAHEIKHILDHAVRHRGNWSEPSLSAGERAERLADYFAGCLLMPAEAVTLRWHELQDVDAIASTFNVSPRAATVRLSQLGLLATRPRCIRPRPDWSRFGAHADSRSIDTTGAPA